MLEALRRGATGWLAKGLLALLILSFAAWGIEDWVRGVSRGSVAVIGSHKVSPEEFQRAYQNEIGQIRESQQGQQLSPKEISQISRNPFFIDRVMNRLIAGAALDQHAKELGLSLSDATIAEELRDLPEFKGIDGKFSKQRYQETLQMSGMSEQNFLNLVRRDELRANLTKALIDAVTPAKTLVEMQYAWREETRVIEHFKFDSEKAVTVPEADEAKLKETFENNKRRFVTPELRKIAVLMLNVDDLKKSVEISDADIKQAYEATKDTYDIPEKRRLQQITFKDKAAADAAKVAIDGGKPFTTAAEETGAKLSDIELGLLTKKQMIDPKIADVAFKLERDKVSDVIEGRYATVLLRATEIQTGKTSTFEDVKDKVRDKLAKEKAAGDIQKMVDQIEDQRIAGKTLKEIGEALKLTFVEIEGTDRNNKTAAGATAFDNPNAMTIITAAFNTQPGLENEAIETDTGGYAWFDVLGITEQKQKPFEDVKDEVKAVYTETERMRLANELAAKLADRATKGEAMATLAAEVGGKVEATLPVTRMTLPQGLTEGAITQAFALAQGSASTATSDDGKSRIIFKVTEIKPAGAPTPEQLTSLSEDIKRQFQNDTLDQYVLALKDRLGVTRNDAELKRLTGGDQQ